MTPLDTAIQDIEAALREASYIREHWIHTLDGTRETIKTRLKTAAATLRDIRDNQEITA